MHCEICGQDNWYSDGFIWVCNECGNEVADTLQIKLSEIFEDDEDLDE